MPFYCASDVDANIQNELRNRPNVQFVSLTPDVGRLGAFWRFLALNDHPLHGNPIIASMFGCRGQTLPELLPLIQQFNPTPGYGPDEDFLAQVVHPLMQGKVLTHADFFDAPPTTPCTPFPTARVGLEFVGQVFDEHDVPNQYYTSVLAEHLAKRSG